MTINSNRIPNDEPQTERENSSATGNDMNEELFTLPFSILTAEAHNILFQWLEKQSEGHFSRDNFSIGKIYKKFYGAHAFWYSVKPEAMKSGGFATPREIVIIPGSSSVPQEVIELAAHYDFMKLIDLDKKALSVTEYAPIKVDIKESEAKALEKLKKQQPSFFDGDDNLKSGVELEIAFPIALPVWEGFYTMGLSKEHRFYIEAQTGEIQGEAYTNDGFKSLIDRFNIQPKQVKVTAIIVAILLLLIILGKITSRPQKPIPAPIPTTPTTVTTVLPSPTATAMASATPTATVTPTATPSADATNNADKAKSDVEKVVSDSFKFITDKKFEDLLNTRSSKIRENNNADTYRNRYDGNISMIPDKITVDKVDDSSADVTVDYTAVDQRGDKKETSTGGIKLHLILEDGKWVIDDSTQLPETVVSSESSEDAAPEESETPQN